LSDCLLVAVTEKRTREEIAPLAAAFIAGEDVPQCGAMRKYNPAIPIFRGLLQSSLWMLPPDAELWGCEHSGDGHGFEATLTWT